ncbi:glycosyltransferase family 2 protein [Rhizobium leguminosarum]|uniref:glycosyltransferase family 2 protein n=1 Tax=Rhizobium leguminosarum TaxID=384 RepID=UPI001AE50C16|nr:glycosyltransferase [Rhizobium leguminosarum]MBP2446506.1 glycosyltransferase involved in cell wall biosynthesis [Rhizobium leguminosarum]
MPRVSICIPSYNPDYFEQALRSALAQTYTDVEIIVSDDCPTDAIEKICQRYAGFLTYSRNPNPGPLTNLVRMMELAQGEYIKFAFDDDILNPFCVQFLLEALETTRHQNTKLAFSPRFTINSQGHFTNLINPFQVSDGLKVISGRDFIWLTAMRHHNLIGEYSTVLFRREDCFTSDGEFRLFDVNGLILPDLAAWLDIAQRGAFVAHPQPLSYFRQHENATSNPEKSPNFVHCILFHEKILNSARERGYVTDKDLPEAYRNLANVYRYWVGTFPQLKDSIERFESYAFSGFAPPLAANF